MIFWLFCAFIWFTNIEKMTSGFLQLESTVKVFFFKFGVEVGVGESIESAPLV
jgi:hypothetical protein